MSIKKFVLTVAVMTISGCNTNMSAGPSVSTPNNQTTTPAMQDTVAQIPESITTMVKQRLGGTTGDLKAELKDREWIIANTDYPESKNIPEGRKLWHVTATGDFPAPDSEVKLRYKSALVLVDSTDERVVYLTLREAQPIQ